MSSTFLVTPQWQGSASARAMRLAEGAEMLAGDLPATATRRVPVPRAAGDAQGTPVHRLTSIDHVRRALRHELGEVTNRPIVIGGDCGVELGAIEHALEQHGDGLAVVWFDAHPDLNSPEGSPSGAFTGMVARALLGDAPEQLRPARPLLPRRLIVAGARAFDDDESDYADAAGVRMIGPLELEDPAALVEAVAETGATAVYVHIDLDVLDPAEFAAASTPEPFGLTVAELTSLVRGLRERWPLVGAGLTCFAPSDEDQVRDELPTVLRVLATLARD